MAWMVDEIGRRDGAINFRDFMELALYHPRHGYYSSTRSRYGRHGDFLTAPTASSWYGRILARVLRRATDTHESMVFVDVASGDGSLITAILADPRSRADGLREIVSVERSPAMRAIQMKRFAGSVVPVKVVSSIEELGEVSGPLMLHASELYDAMPVHRVVCHDHQLREFFVQRDGKKLEWLELDADERLEGYFRSHSVELVPGQIAEANLESEPFHNQLLSAAGDDGLALILDYGYPAQRLYNSRGRAGGSLVAYREHRLVTDLLADPGLQDLTAHVNWDDLRRAAVGAGWREIGLWPLAEFLVRAGLAAEVASEGLGMEADLDAHTVTERQEIKRLLDPDGMGSDLKMLVQGRGSLADIAEGLLAEQV